MLRGVIIYGGVDGEVNKCAEHFSHVLGRNLSAAADFVLSIYCPGGELRRNTDAEDIRRVLSLSKHF